MPKKKQTSSLFTAVRRFFRLLELTAVFLLGALLSNLDRLEDWTVHLPENRPSPMQSVPEPSLPKENAAAGDRLSGRIIRVYDGDTATLQIGDQQYNIRLYGIDAPELKQEGGIASRDRLQKKILNQEVCVAVVNEDFYGRLVGTVFLGSRCINLEMAAEGWCWYYEDYAKDAHDIRDAVQTARRMRYGIWQHPDPLPPWEFRK